MLQDIATLLGHEEWDVRQAAIKALQGRADLTEEMLQDITTLLRHEEWDVRQAAIEVLMDQAALSLETLGLYVKPLYKALLQKSFKEHLYWYASDRVFIRVDLRYISLSCKQENQHRDEIWEIRNNLGVPLSNS
jgi:HEAT repeats